ncbi:MAG: protein-L-isoaspartate(D-aspartate) O-methyltransferase [Planctomycetes bacterium]|nr:protein-L-isoaspartate(D-aspartate) O-methyltransferase [Planctomycetota bacterium]
MRNTKAIKKVSLKALCFIFVILFVNHQTQAKEKDTINFEAKDGLIVTADLFAPHPNETPFIILFHQAQWSRGEYIEIAPKLNKMGFNCMAVDLRSGGNVNDITNETNQRAIKLGKPTDYLDALQDMESAVKYVKSKYESSKIILWGSSYSASLVIKLAEDNPALIDGVLAFSPGDYFDRSKTYIKDSAKNIKCPIFITSALKEEKAWEKIFHAIPSKHKHSFLPKTQGNHGSRALWEKFHDSKDYWQAVSKFLHQYFGEKNNNKNDVQVKGKAIIDKETPEPNWPHPRSDEYIEQRCQMVRHIRGNYGLKDEKVLKAMEDVPRHWFVPEKSAPLAYADRPLPIGYNQTISHPFIVAYMTNQLKLDKNQKVLEIGTGSGYQAAVLTEFTPHVYTIEILEPLARATAKRLRELGYTTVKTRIGDGYKGWPEYQPFDAIIVTAAPDHIPDDLLQQLAPGGRMVLPVGGTFATQELLLITKDAKGRITQKNLMPVRFVPMVPGNSK